MQIHPWILLEVLLHLSLLDFWEKPQWVTRSAGVVLFLRRDFSLAMDLLSIHQMEDCLLGSQFFEGPPVFFLILKKRPFVLVALVTTTLSRAMHWPMHFLHRKTHQVISHSRDLTWVRKICQYQIEFGLSPNQNLFL